MPKTISRDSIDETLHKLYIASFHYSSPAEKYCRESAFSALQWYVNTGRAGTGFLYALVSASPEKLLKHCAKHAGTYDETVYACYEYMRKYCRLK